MAGVNSFLNQNVVHLHPDHAFCPVDTDPQRSLRSKRERELENKLKALRSRPRGLGEDEMSHEERRTILAARREAEELYQSQLGTSQKATAAIFERDFTAFDEQRTRLFRYLPEDGSAPVMGWLDQIDFRLRPSADMARRAEFVQRFVKAARTVCARIRAEKMIRYWRERGQFFAKENAASPRAKAAAQDAGEAKGKTPPQAALHQLKLASPRQHLPAPFFVEPIALSHVPKPFAVSTIRIPPPSLDVLELERPPQHEILGYFAVEPVEAMFHLPLEAPPMQPIEED